MAVGRHRLCPRTLVYPDSLGEGKLDNVPDNRAYDVMGCAYRLPQDEASAAACFEKATEGSRVPSLCAATTISPRTASTARAWPMRPRGIRRRRRSPAIS